MAYRAVVIGCGLAGSDMPRSHIEGYLEHPQTTLVGIVDKDINAIKAAAEKWELNNLVASTDVASCLRATKPHIVSICTTEGTHLQVFRKIVAAWIPSAIFFEKPLATSLEACNEIIRTCADHHISTAVNHARAWDINILNTEIPSEIAFGGAPWRNDVHAMNLTQIYAFKDPEKAGEIILNEVEENGLWLDGVPAWGKIRRNVMTNAISNLVFAIQEDAPVACDILDGALAVQAALVFREYADETGISEGDLGERRIQRDEGESPKRGEVPTTLGE